MKYGPVSLGQAAGTILAHHVLDKDGRRTLTKGHLLTSANIESLAALGYTVITAVTLEANDLTENEAARRVGIALCGPGVSLQATGVGRANLIAQVAGPLRVNVDALYRINSIDEGITVAVLREHTLVRAGQLVMLVKIIPFALPTAAVVDVEAIARDYQPAMVVSVRALRACSVALIVSAPDSGRDRLLADFIHPTRTRLERLGSRLAAIVHVPHQPADIAAAMRAQHAAGRDLVILAGISATMDRDDIIPQAVRIAGGRVSQLGVPVDPGSLLMLAWLDAMPIIGAPGCMKSLQTNVIDLILPRLLAGERLTRADLALMGHGGLFDDTLDRPMPRDDRTTVRDRVS